MTCGLLFCLGSAAQSNNPHEWQGGIVLDMSASSKALSMAQRDQGAGFGHSDVAFYGPLGDQLEAEVIASFHTLNHKLDTHMELAWVQTTRLPLGLQLRAGRFSSQLGYWNEIHSHEDDFVERGIIERAFLGGHWNDDGVRLNWIAPTEMFVRVGLEAFSGRALTPNSSNGHGAQVLSFKLGDDIGTEHSWQWGLSRVNNQREDQVPTVGVAVADAEGPWFQGRAMWVTDAVWKWAPGGNPGLQQVRLVAEWAQLDRALPSAGLTQGHQAHNIGLVWRFEPDYETGVRIDRLQAHAPSNPSGTVLAVPASWNETHWMVAYKPTDRQTLRLQLSRQSTMGQVVALGLPGKPGHSVMVQYILAFGAHGAHPY